MVIFQRCAARAITRNLQLETLTGEMKVFVHGWPLLISPRVFVWVLFTVEKQNISISLSMIFEKKLRQYLLVRTDIIE